MYQSELLEVGDLVEYGVDSKYKSVYDLGYVIRVIKKIDPYADPASLQDTYQIRWIVGQNDTTETQDSILAWTDIVGPPRIHKVKY